MTTEEYAQIIGNELVNAHNNKDITTLTATFKKADQELENSKISLPGRKTFWEKVSEVVFSGRLLIERQTNSALLVLMQTLQREIEARTGKDK